MVRASAAQHKATKQQSNKPKLAEVGNLTDEPTTTWKRTLNATRVVSLQTRTTALQTKARDYYGRDYNKGQAPEPQLRTERELPTVRTDDTKLRRSYRLNTKREKIRNERGVMQSAKFRQRFAPWSQPFGQAPKRSAIRSAQWTPKVHGMSLDTCKTQTCDKCDNGCTTTNQQNFAIGSLLGASRLARLREKLSR
jgi:hypothetical protein